MWIIVYLYDDVSGDSWQLVIAIPNEGDVFFMFWKTFISLWLHSHLKVLPSNGCYSKYFTILIDTYELTLCFELEVCSMDPCEFDNLCWETWICVWCSYRLICKQWWCKLHIYVKFDLQFSLNALTII